ncbi:MAG: hypothetical protein HQM09_24085 [Candidatus Riflebacteria bacterium]|nr:hypothetical protein [Candidatus Riflebacteria bacterium]
MQREKMIEDLSNLEDNVHIDTKRSSHGHGCESFVATCNGIVSIAGDSGIGISEVTIDKKRYREILKG